MGNTAVNTGGITIKCGLFSLDFAFAMHENLENQQFASLRYNWGRKKERKIEKKEIKMDRKIKVKKKKILKGKNIAVSGLEGRPPLSASDVAFITDFLRSAIIETGVFNVVDRNNMEKVLAEQGFQQTGCTTEECAVQMGKLLNVHLIAVGSCGKLLSRFILTINIVDVETGKFIYSAKEACYSEEEIEIMVERIVERIVAEFQ